MACHFDQRLRRIRGNSIRVSTQRLRTPCTLPKLTILLLAMTLARSVESLPCRTGLKPFLQATETAPAS
jgi:hypothetical protein